jgi:hypothetical protein
MGLRRADVLGAVVVAAIQVAGTAGAAHSHAATGRPYEPLAWGLLVLSAAGLLLRRWSPVAAMVATAVPVWVYLALGYPGGPVYLAVIGALIGAIVRGRRVAAWVALAVGYPMFVWVAPLVAGRRRPRRRRGRRRPPGWSRSRVVELVKTRRERAASSAAPGRRKRGGGPASSGWRSPANCTTCSRTTSR